MRLCLPTSRRRSSRSTRVTRATRTSKVAGDETRNRRAMAGGAGDGREHTAACAFARSEYATERQQRNDMPENGHREMSDAHTARSECMHTRVRRLVCVLCLRGAYTSPCAMWGVPGRGAPDGAWAWSSRRRTEATRIIIWYMQLVRCKVFLGNLGSGPRPTT
jgi:hypothetical protein